jgi:predicted kinase
MVPPKAGVGDIVERRRCPIVASRVDAEAAHVEAIVAVLRPRSRARTGVTYS